MPKKVHKGYSIVIIPENGSGSTTIPMSVGRFRLIVLLIVLWISTIVAIISFWGSYAYDKQQLTELRKEYSSITEQANRVAKVEENLIEMDRYIRYIRLAMTMTGKEQPPALEEFIVNDSLKKSYELSAESENFSNMPNIAPVVKGWVSRAFSEKEEHFGVDYAAAVGVSVRAPARGLVVDISIDEFLGNTVTIDHGNGFVTRFAHCKDIIAQKGDSVERGEMVATVGNSGKSTSGSHLHFELKKDGVLVDPELFIVKGL